MSEAINQYLRLLCLCLMAMAVQADLPVHCMPKDIQGTWSIYLEDKPLTTSQRACGHEHPDKNTDHLYSEPASLITPVSPPLLLTLDFPNVVSLDAKPAGNWSMVYDEGFQIFINKGQAMETYFAFSKYKFNADSNREPKDDDDEKSEGYVSLCESTFLGWYQNYQGKWGCFYAKRISQPNGPKDGAIPENDDTHRMMKMLQKDENKIKIVQRNTTSPELTALVNKKTNSTKNHLLDGPVPEEEETTVPQNDKLYERFKEKQQLYQMPHQNLMESSGFDSQQTFEQDISFIELVNDVKSKSPWKAQQYDQFEGKTTKQMQTLLGMTPNKQIKYSQQKAIQSSANPISIFLQESSSATHKHKAHAQHNFKFKANFHQNSKLQQKLKAGMNNKHKTAEEQLLCEGVEDNGLPKCFDWRNVKGENYDTPIKRQGDCGSCYAVAMLSSVESRVRVATNNQDKPFLSVSQAISCNAYNQGCNGGYPYLVAKYGQEMGFALESCSPYSESDQVCKPECLNESQHPVYKVKEYGYVGKGFYGSTNELAMMEEIKAHGPIVLALDAAPDLYYYSSGVFITNPTDVLEQANEHPDMGKWIFTNHAVVCVGWGQVLHDGQPMKYWILKNSWGDEWGENGYFRMLRGVNLAAIENQAIYARL